MAGTEVESWLDAYTRLQSSGQWSGKCNQALPLSFAVSQMCSHPLWTSHPLQAEYRVGLVLPASKFEILDREWLAWINNITTTVLKIKSAPITGIGAASETN